MKTLGLALTTLLAGTALNGMALADDAKPADAAKPAAPALSDIFTSSGLTVTGYVAASYYHSNGYGTDHQFDNKHDSLQVDQAAFTLAYQPKEGFGAVVNIAAGEDMKILNAAEGSNPNTFDIVQGFVQYVGGPIRFLEAARVLNALGATVGGHRFSHYSMHLLASLPRSLPIEMLDWTNPAFYPLAGPDVSGRLPVEGPGFRIVLDQAVIDRHGVKLLLQP